MFKATSWLTVSLLVTVGIHSSLCYSDTDVEDYDEYEEELNDEPTYRCGEPDMNFFRRIVGGETTVPHTFPWQVSVQRRGTNGFFHTCGGSLVNERWVLTACHCIDDIKSPYDVRVVLGDHDRSKLEGTEIVADVQRLLKHNRYIGEYNYWQDDIAGLKLAKPVTFTRYVRPVCLPTDGSTDDIVNCYSVGWGKNQTNGKSLQVLNQVKMTYYPLKTCRKSSWNGAVVTSKMLCAGNAEGGHGTCQGDSGGPLLCLGREGNQWTQYGVTSWAKGNCSSPNHPTVFTRISSYLDWISYYMD